MVDNDEVDGVIRRVQRPAGSVILSVSVVGSHSHGTHIPPADDLGIDDVDLIAIVLPPPGVVLGIDSWDHSQQWVNQYDVVAYSLGKLMRLLAKSNPNVLGLLALPDDCSLLSGATWRALIEHRDLFLTKEAFGSFAGYANGQLKRMEHSAYNGYMGEKRKAIVDRIGYDTKNASHLIRLLRMCRDLFLLGELVVRRPDAEELISIKRGERTLEDIRREAESLFVEAKRAVDASSLPDRINRGRVSDLSAELHLAGWSTGTRYG